MYRTIFRYVEIINQD